MAYNALGSGNTEDDETVTEVQLRHILVCMFSSWWLFAVSTTAVADEIRPVDPTRVPALSTYSAIVLQSMLEQMGLALPPEARGGPPAPGTEPEPEPAADGDDFFDDDDFFDEDVGFDDMVDRMDAEFDETVSAWDEEYEEQVAKWEQAREVYLEKEARYSSSTIPLEAPSDSTSPALGTGDSVAAGLETMQPGEFHLIPNSMALPVRNQADRGTCTAFSGVRALETLMIQHGLATDLSEHHFYFLSKPSCREQPCDIRQKGSTVDAGLKETRYTRSPALVTEDMCPYVQEEKEQNITYAPLSDCDLNGVIRAGELRPVSHVASSSQVLTELRNNRPVVAGFTLSRSYRFNRGLVRYFDPELGEARRGSQKGGHANLLIGFIKLPASLSREGDYCLITVNSWDPGWGRGGYACLTERWLREHLHSAVALGSAVLTDYGLAYFGLE